MMTRMFVIMAILSLFSCFEIVRLDVQNTPEESFPFIEVVYNSNTGWQTIFDKTRLLNTEKTDSVELEYFQLYENDEMVYFWPNDMHNSLYIDYIPKPDQSYHVVAKIIGFDEIESDVQTIYPKPILDTCYVLDDIIVCTWKNPDRDAGYYIQYTSDSSTGSYRRRPEIIKTKESDLPEILSYSFNVPFRASEISISLSRLSDGLIEFYDSLEKYDRTYDDGTTDPERFYSNLSEGFGVFGLVSQSDSLRLKIK